MFRRHLTTIATTCFLASAPAFVEGAGQTAPSLDELKAAIQPLLEGFALTTQQQNKANAAMSKEVWTATLEGFKIRRRGEIFKTTHDKMNALVPTVMMPRMTGHGMKKMMADRKGRMAGPPTAKELEAVRKDTKELMRSKLRPQLMGNLEELADERMKEVLADKKALVRVLGEKVSQVALEGGQKAKFDKALTDAGYPGNLIHGPDAVLEERMRTMMKEVTDKELTAMGAKD